MIEKFGYNEKPLDDEEWMDIGNKMKSDPHIRYKTLRMVAEAEHQSQRFYNLAYLTGTVLFLAFLKFPVIRIQPGFQRVGAAGVLAYPFYNYMHGLAERLKVKRIKFAFRKHIAYGGLHPKIKV